MLFVLALLLASLTPADAAALARADQSILDHRRGPAHVTLAAMPGSIIHVKLKRHAFNFGADAAGHTASEFNTLVNRPNYASFFTSHFNSIVTEDGGGWAANEATRDVNNMTAIDAMAAWATARDLSLRVHPMLYALDGASPGWAQTLLNSAAGGSQSAKQQLRDEISERIAYYARSSYDEIDVVNEFVHFPKFWQVFGDAGIASIFNETKTANANARLFLNEYFVLQYGPDDNGQWYLDRVQDLQRAGGAIDGIGIEYYVGHDTGQYAHSAARIERVLQNLASSGLDITLSEFGAAPNVSPNEAADILNQTMRLVFGSPNATTFNIWGFTPIDVWDEAPQAVLVDANWNLTPAGVAYEALMRQWDTDLTLTVGPDHAIDFTGYYGRYDVTIAGQTYTLNLANGTTQYALGTLAGDFNFDGVVNAADYTVWRNAGGTQAQYDQWKLHFGETLGGASVVREPTTTALAMLASLTKLLLLRRRSILET